MLFRSSMEGELSDMTAEMEKRVLHQLRSMDEKDIKAAGLTERQKEVAILRLKHSYTEIGKMLCVEPSTAFRIFKATVKKIRAFKQQRQQEDHTILSGQQLKIYTLYNEGKSKNQVAEILGVSVNTVKTQFRRINEKLGVTKVCKIS